MSLEEAHVRRIAKSVAARYRRSTWWASFEDMEQEAVCAIMQAQHTFNPRLGFDEGAYAFRAAVLAVRRYLWQESSPVSGGKHRPEISLANLHRASLDDFGDGLTADEDPEEQLQAFQLRNILRERLLALLSVMELAPTSEKTREAIVDRVLEEQPTLNNLEALLRTALLHRARADKVLRETLLDSA